MKNKLDSNKDKLIRLAISFLMAFFLWVYALSATDQTDTKQFKDVPVRIINTSSLTSAGLALDDVDFTVDVKLYGSTLSVSQIRKSEISAVIDVSGISSVGNHSVAVNVSGVSENVSVSEIKERYLNISVSELAEAEKNVEVVKNGEVSEGYAIIGETRSFSSASVYGNETNVSKVSYVRGNIDVNGTASDITRRANLAAYDENGNIVPHVTVVPSYVDVNIVVGKIKEVPIRAVTVGEVSEGYVLGDVTVEKETVKIAAKDDILNTIDHIFTADIDITGRSSAFIQTVSLHGYEDMLLLEDDPVKVEIVIELKENKEIDFAGVSFLNTPPSLNCSLVGFEGFSCVFSGDRRILSQIDEGDITAYIDLEGLKEGEYDLPVMFNVPQGVEVRAGQDIKVKVRLKK